MTFAGFLLRGGARSDKTYAKGKYIRQGDFMTIPSRKEKYTQKTDIPQYNPTGEQPEIHELIDEKKTDALISEINLSSVSNKERAFLEKAACRHLAFNYRKIAEYYACASKEMQELMEKSALVIIDYENAIKNGYAKLSKRMAELRESNAQ